MTAERLSRLQKNILRLLAEHHKRTRGMMSSSYPELVRTIPNDYGNISHSVRNLEMKGLVELGRTQGGQVQWVVLTREGHKRASEIT